LVNNEDFVTGAIVATLGFEHAGVFSNDDQLVQRIQAAGRFFMYSHDYLLKFCIFM